MLVFCIFLMFFVCLLQNNTYICTDKLPYNRLTKEEISYFSNHYSFNKLKFSL